MKKCVLLLFFAVFFISCSKKEVIISGKINNASPLNRIEIIDVSSVATLPIANFGVDEKGNFSDTIKLEKDGVYAMIYNGSVNFIHLKKGNNINITGNGSTFPQDIKIAGEGKSNNEFLTESQQYINEYFSKLSPDLFTKDESSFIKEIEKFIKEINNKIDEIAKKTKADTEIIQWKKDDLLVNLLIISSQYEREHGRLSQKPDFKVSAKFKELQKKAEKSSFIKTFPLYKQYLLMQMQDDFAKFATPYAGSTEITQSEIFLKFLDTKKEVSKETKDYLTAFVATEHDLHPQNSKFKQAQKVLEEKIKTESVKKDLQKVYLAVGGLPIGTQTPEGNLISQNNKAVKISDFKGKPTLLVFYSSFSRGMVESIVPILKELKTFYKEKVEFVYINMDDNKTQFKKTSESLMKGLVGTNVYAQGGLKSELAKQFHIYGFKLPSFVIVDKDGKIASKAILNISDPQFTEILGKLTGLSIPAIQPSYMEEGHHEHDGHNH